MTKSLIVLAFALTLAGSASTAALARQGADDGAIHEHKGGKTADGVNHTFNLQNNLFEMARRGADDPAGDDRGGATKTKGGKGRGGADDAAGHASLIEMNPSMQMARRGGGHDGAGHA